MTQQFKVVGTRQPLVDSWKKVAGAAVYGDDVRFPGTLSCRLLRSTLAHAKIVRVDTSRAAAMPGVRAIVTGEDARAKFGVLPISQDEEAVARVQSLGSQSTSDELGALPKLRVRPRLAGTARAVRDQRSPLRVSGNRVVRELGQRGSCAPCDRRIEGRPRELRRYGHRTRPVAAFTRSCLHDTWARPAIASVARPARPTGRCKPRSPCPGPGPPRRAPRGTASGRRPGPAGPAR